MRIRTANTDDAAAIAEVHVRSWQAAYRGVFPDDVLDGPDGSTGEVVAIYARPEAWGTGAGRALMMAALDGLRGAGFRDATLWVLDSNARARRFYERAGFAPDSAVKDDVMAGTTITEVRYRRTLSGSPG